MFDIKNTETLAGVYWRHTGLQAFYRGLAPSPDAMGITFICQ